ncbi:hypothetical protein D3C87_1364600 [compost metagenome]
MQRKDDGDREAPIGHPVRRCQAHRLEPAGLAANGAVLEQRRPGESEGPCGQHVGHDQRGREPAATEHVRAADKPGKHRADNKRKRNRPQSDGERVEERMPEKIRCDGREERPVEIIEREVTDILAKTPFVAKLDTDGIQNDRDDRNDDQIGEK